MIATRAPSPKKILLARFTEMNMAGFEWGDSYYLTPAEDGTFTVSARRRRAEGLRTGTEIFTALWRFMGDDGHEIGSIDINEVADKVAKVSPALADEFRKYGRKSGAGPRVNWKRIGEHQRILERPDDIDRASVNAQLAAAARAAANEPFGVSPELQELEARLRREYEQKVSGLRQTMNVQADLDDVAEDPARPWKTHTPRRRGFYELEVIQLRGHLLDAEWRGQWFLHGDPMDEFFKVLHWRKRKT